MRYRSSSRPAPARLRLVTGVGRAFAGWLLLALLAPALATAQAPATPVVTRLVPSATSLELTVGERVPFTVSAFDATGAELQAAVRLGGDRRALRVGGGFVVGLAAGEFEIVATSVTAPDSGVPPVAIRVPVLVRWPAVTTVRVESSPDGLYVGTRLAHRARATHADGSERPNPAVTWTSSDPAVATVDAFGNVRARAVGEVAITAAVEGVAGRVVYAVEAFPAATIELTGGDLEHAGSVRTGDVLEFEARALGSDGSPVADVAVSWSHSFVPDDSIVAPSAPGQLEDGRFVADVPGVYTVVAAAGPIREERSFHVVPRDVIQRVEILGQGREARVFTTDFWVWEGVDGRDYALTGSKMGDGISFIWDVTDPAAIVKTDSIQVDARTTNDLKVSPGGRWGAISREGASNRRNGVVLLDLSDPAHPRVASTYDDGLTGGVHNMFATDDHLFALSNGDKYVILDVTDLENPRYVSEYDHPDSRVHDVWVHDGIAYSAEWGTGVVVVDVGNGRWGGTIEQPRLVTTFPLPSGQTHAVFPYYQESTGTFYLFVGDEIVSRTGKAWEGTGPDHRVQYDPATGMGGYPRATSGYVQIVDFTDPENPEMVARYHVDEYGTHNLWVEDDILYQAYYEGGVRMVDVSGPLMGNLYTQGREIAVFKAHDPIGYIPNSPGAWSVMPYKGRIFFSDINSGMWAIRLQPKERPVS